jgi:serine/threonine protein phosphatase PrpC
MVSLNILYLTVLFFLLGGEASSSTSNDDYSCKANPPASLNATAADDDNNNSSNNNDDYDDCPIGGCPFEPLDIIFGKEASEALYQLRRAEYDSRDNVIPKTDQEMVTLLEPLLTAGTADVSTFSLKGKTHGETHAINQDCAVIYSPFEIIPGKWASSSSAQLMGVFDGHGEQGETVSQHAAKEIPRLLSTKLSQLATETTNDHRLAVSQAIKDTFLQVDETVGPSEGTTSGTTASIILQLDNELYIANVGNSLSFVAVFLDDNFLYMVSQSDRDKPGYPQERQRIEMSGGRVILDEQHGAMACQMEEESGRCIPMSRAIGDWDIPGVTADPIVHVRSIDDFVSVAMNSYANEFCSSAADDEECPMPSDVKMFAFSVTDGDVFLQAMDTADIAHVYAASFFVKDNPHPHTASEYVLVKAAHWWDQLTNEEFRDDMAMAAMKVWS